MDAEESIHGCTAAVSEIGILRYGALGDSLKHCINLMAYRFLLPGFNLINVNPATNIRPQDH